MVGENENKIHSYGLLNKENDSKKLNKNSNRYSTNNLKVDKEKENVHLIIDKNAKNLKVNSNKSSVNFLNKNKSAVQNLGKNKITKEIGKKLQNDKNTNKWIKTDNTNTPRLLYSIDNSKNYTQPEGLSLNDLDHSSFNRSSFQIQPQSVSYNDFLYKFNKVVKKKIEKTENKKFYILNLHSSINH